jgi:hypothetical protein
MMAEIERITTVWDARFDRLEEKLNKAVRASYGAAGKIEKRFDAANGNISRIFGKADPGKALDKVFDATRFKVLDSGVARVGLFGSALESLGPAGLGAAAAIGTLAAAFVGAREAARFADDIADTADRLHVTTDALQEYRFAIRAAGGEEKGADEALEKFSITLGKAQAGFSKAQKGFLSIGFTKEQIKGFTDVETTIPKVAEHLQGLSAAQKDAALSLLGLDGLKQLFDKGPEQMAALRQEAHALGIVMDAELVKRGGELNDQFETVQKVIDVQLKSALVDLGPVLVDLLKLVAELAKAAADVADAFRSIQNKRTAALTRARDERLRQADSPVAKAIPGLRERILGEAAKFDDELKKREAGAAATPAPPKPTRQLADLSKSGKGSAPPRDGTLQRTEEVNSAIAAAERDMLQALLGLTSDVETRAKIQKEILAQEVAQDAARLNKQIAAIKADEGLSAPTKKSLIARLEQVKADQAVAILARETEIDREKEEALARQALDVRQTTLDGEAALLQLQQGLSRSSSEQQSIALRLVEIAYQRERAELEAVIASKAVSEADRQIARLKLGQLEQQQPGQVEQATREGSDPARVANDIIGGIQKQSSLAEDTSAMYAEIERQRQENLISDQEASQAGAQVHARYLEQRLSASQEFFGNLASLSSSSNKTLAAIGKAAAITQATIDGFLAVNRALGALPPPFNFAAAAVVGAAAAVNVAKIAGLADGGRVSGPGGPRDDKVLTRLSNGEFVVNARDSARNLDLLQQINSGRTPGFADGGMVGRNLAAPRMTGVRGPAQVVQPTHFHLEGAVVTQELVDQMNQVSQRNSAAAGAKARRDAAGDAAALRYGQDLNS